MIHPFLFYVRPLVLCLYYLYNCSIKEGPLARTFLLPFSPLYLISTERASERGQLDLNSLLNSWAGFIKPTFLYIHNPFFFVAFYFFLLLPY